MRREFRLPTILGVLIAFSGLLAGLVLVKSNLGGLASASVGEIPSDVRITNVSDTGFTVSWITSKATSGFVQYGLEQEIPDLVVSDERDLRNGSIDSYFTHYVNIQGLVAETEYNFKIGSGKGLFGQAGETSYQVKTGPRISTVPMADVAYGQANTATGNPADGALVYLSMLGAAPRSALVKSSGSWVIPLSTTRNINLDDYVQYDKESGVLELTALDGQGGVSVVTTTTNEDSPLTLIVLGENNNQATATPSATPIPDTSDEEGGSKFSGEV
ncbi:MAG: fibronectin type III domain-containing protein [Patescibacteria group bacterium]